MASVEKDVAEQWATYSLLSGLFVSVLAAVGLLRRQDRELEPFDLVQLGLASFRMGRLISYDKVMEAYRAPFTRTVPDQTGAGDTVEARGSGWRRAVGELISCPICAGTWIAAALVYGPEFAPGPTRTLLAVMSAIGLGELLNALTEYLGWQGQAGRVQSGAFNRPKAE